MFGIRDEDCSIKRRELRLDWGQKGRWVCERYCDGNLAEGM